MSIFSRKISDQAVIDGILQGGESLEKTVRRFYDQNFGFVYKALKSHKLEKSEAVDAYADAVLTVKNHIEKKVFRGDSKLSTYLFSIFNRRCIDLFRKQTTHPSTYTYELPMHLQDRSPGIQKILEVRESEAALRECIAQLGATCQQVLIDWAFLGYKMDEIAKRAGLKDRKTAASKKYTCLQQLKKVFLKRRAQDER